MPDVSEIIERLRAKACSPDEYRHWNYVEAVTLEQAEAAVLAAVAAERERIVKLLRDEAADGAWVEVARSALRAAADVIESEARVAREGSRDE